MVFADSNLQEKPESHNWFVLIRSQLRSQLSLSVHTLSKCIALLSILSDLEPVPSSFLMQERHIFVCVRISPFSDPTFYVAPPSLHSQTLPTHTPAGNFLRQTYNYFIALPHFSISVLPTELDSPELKTWLRIM